MAVKNIDARIKNKRDSAISWEYYNPVLLNGEIIIVDTSAGEVREKIGDGRSKYSQLPFTDENLRNQLSSKLTVPNGTQGQLLGFTGTNVVGAMNVPFTRSFSSTLSTYWNTTSSGYIQTIYIPGIASTSNPVIIPQWSANIPSNAERSSWDAIVSVATSQNYLTFYSKIKPTTSVSFIAYY